MVPAALEPSSAIRQNASELGPCRPGGVSDKKPANQRMNITVPNQKRTFNCKSVNKLNSDVHTPVWKQHLTSFPKNHDWFLFQNLVSARVGPEQRGSSICERTQLVQSACVSK
jgi:hypothetical protein